jgi:Rrf2 family protein
VRVQVATRLALFAVFQLAADPRKQHAAAEIAQRFGISVNHLSKVLRTLGRAGLVEALRGAGGGYRFKGNPRRVTLLDVIELFEPIGAAAGDQEPEGPSAEGRALHRVFDEIDDIARGTLSSISLATMLALIDEARRPSAEAGRPAAT